MGTKKKCRFSVNSKKCLECTLYEKCWQKSENRKAIKSFSQEKFDPDQCTNILQRTPDYDVLNLY